MKHHRILLAVAMLVLATLACQAVMGGGARDADEDSVSPTESIVQPTQESQSAEGPTAAPTEATAATGSGSDVSSQFPMTADAYNVVEAGDGSLIYYTKLSADEVVQFYRDEYSSRGYTERKDLTLVDKSVISMVFDGDPSGKSVVIQSVDLGDGSRTISIRLEQV